MKPISIVTHSGHFHADELFALAVLSLKFEDNIDITRTRDEAKFAQADYVVDIGGVYDAEKCRFDHHQHGGAGNRENGIPYAAFGLVWKQFGSELCGSQDIADVVEEKLVQPLDAHDNGMEIFQKVSEHVEPFTLSKMIHIFNPTWTEGMEEFDTIFKNLIPIAKQIIKREIKIAQDKELAKENVIQAYTNATDKRLIILDAAYPISEILSEYPEPLFIVRPDSTPGLWKVSTIRDNMHEFKNKKDLPKAWGGKRGEELAQVSGVADATFCHQGLFIAIAKSKEGAIALAQLAVNA
jgi:uncharacterized UPF0160 family protein